MHADAEGYQVGGNPVILFDGMCCLCSGAVAFLIRRDSRAHFRFAPLQSDGAKALVGALGFSPAALPDSLVLIESGHAYVRSTAALRIARALAFPWLLLYAFILVPRAIRDGIYDFIAAHRYRWFGRREACMTPAPEAQRRFLESGG